MGSRTELCTPTSCNTTARSEKSSSKQFSVKRLREDSETSVNSVDQVEAVKHIDHVKRITMLEMQITKLKQDNQKLKIESEFKEQEKKYSFLRDDEEERSTRDRVVTQRNTLYDKNADLTEELESVSETYRKFHKEMTEKNIKLLSEVGDVKTKLLQTSDELFIERRKAAHEIWLTEKRLREELSERDVKLITLQNDNKLKELTITTVTHDLESIQGRLAEFNSLQKSEFQLRMELDSMKNKELYATVFPEKIIKSAQVHEDNIRLQRDIKDLKDEKDYTKLLKIQIEDGQGEIAALKKQLSQYQACKDQYESLSGELSDWKTVQSELNMISPLSIISTISQLQKDTLQMTSAIEKYKSEITSLKSEVSELTTVHQKLKQTASTEQESCEAIRKKLSVCEVKCTEYREEAASCKKLLETYQSASEEERQTLPKKHGSKIIHMKLNPYQNKLDSELKRLSEENSHLKKQLELSDNVSVVNELEQCQQKLAESEASVKKTKTIFQTKVKEFKEGIYDLFGYTVTCPADSQYSLLSVFATTQEDSILFYRDKNNMQLMDTKFTKTLDMQAHIRKLTQHKCIPLFLCDVTSDLFHRQTFVDFPEQTCEISALSTRNNI